MGQSTATDLHWSFFWILFWQLLMIPRCCRNFKSKHEQLFPRGVWCVKSCSQGMAVIALQSKINWPMCYAFRLLVVVFDLYRFCWCRRSISDEYIHTSVLDMHALICCWYLFIQQVVHFMHIYNSFIIHSHIKAWSILNMIFQCMYIYIHMWFRWLII